MVNTKLFCDSLKKHDIDFFAGVPDSLLKDFCAFLQSNVDSSHNIITANEGNAVAMCAGYHVSTGKIGAVYMQNSGEGNAVNPLMSLTDPDVYSIPVFLIVGWRGEPGVHDEPQHVKQGKVTIPLLEAMGIPHEILSDDFEPQINRAITYMRQFNAPYAIVVKKSSFSSCALAVKNNQYSITREEALKTIIHELGKDDFVVSTTGKTSREIFEIREESKEGHSNDFLTVGSMGHTASIAYGMALGTDKKVWCIDGDGSFIMHMGGIGVICSKMLPNFKYIVNVNDAHESVGGQPTCSPNLDFEKILRGLGFRKVIIAENQKQIEDGVKQLASNFGFALVLHTKQGSRSNLGRPTTTPVENKLALMNRIKVKE